MIEDNAWLGADVKVLDGVNVGRDAVAGAGSVVVRNIPAFAVATGMPAKVLKERERTSTMANGMNGAGQDK